MDFFDADAIIGRAIDQDEATAPTIDDLVAEMDRTGIQRSLVTNQSILFSTPDWGNDRLLRDVAGKPRLRPVCGTWIMQERGDVTVTQHIDQLIRHGAAGVQLWPSASMFEFAPWQAPEFFAVMSERRLPIFMHVDQTNWNAVHAVLTAFPKLVLVLQRVVYSDSRKALALMKACPGLHICTSPGFVGGSVLEQFDRFVGCDRLIFGTGLFKFDATPAVAQISYSTLSDDKKARIASGNLVRLLEAIR